MLALAQKWQEGLGELDESENVCLKSLSDQFHGSLAWLHAVFRTDASIIDEDVKTAKLRENGLSSGLDAFWRGHVKEKKVSLWSDTGNRGLPFGRLAGT